MRFIEGVTQNFGKAGFVKKESFNDKFNEKYLKYPMYYNIPCIYLKPITDVEKINLTCP